MICFFIAIIISPTVTGSISLPFCFFFLLDGSFPIIIPKNDDLWLSCSCLFIIEFSLTRTTTNTPTHHLASFHHLQSIKVVVVFVKKYSQNSPSFSTSGNKMASNSSEKSEYAIQHLKDIKIAIEYKHLAKHAPGGVYLMPCS